MSTRIQTQEISKGLSAACLVIPADTMLTAFSRNKAN